ncbi:MAG TPA: PQQ-dependent sugar dehydrogenase [Chryseolinea sp.]
MKMQVKTGALIIGFILSLAVVSAQDGAAIYATYCAGCHGAQLQGASAAPLIKTDWIYGRSKGMIFRNIKFGIPGTEMIGWGKALNEEQITAVTDFVMASQTLPPDARRPVPGTLKTKDYTIKVEELVTTGIRTPWGIAFIDASHALITERPGAIRLMVNGKLDPKSISGLPSTTFQQPTGGYFDVAVDPNYQNNGWIYLAYGHTNENPADKNAASMTKVVRGKIKDYQWVEHQTLFEVPDSLKVRGGNRWGGRLFFDKDGLLFFSIGDMARGDDSQDLSKPTGKVFRILPDGSIPKDNPFVKNSNALPAIYSIGNRNVQGFSQHPFSGEIWMTEHGPMGGDELNILKKGGNYGWPVITYGVDYSGDIVSTDTVKAGMLQPVVHWTPSIAVCPAQFITGKLFSKWTTNLLVGALAFEEIRRLEITKENKVAEQEIILKGVGRIRDLKAGPDGAIYVLLNDPDMVLRLTPQ